MASSKTEDRIEEARNTLAKFLQNGFGGQTLCATKELLGRRLFELLRANPELAKEKFSVGGGKEFPLVFLLAVKGKPFSWVRQVYEMHPGVMQEGNSGHHPLEAAIRFENDANIIMFLVEQLCAAANHSDDAYSKICHNDFQCPAWNLVDFWLKDEIETDTFLHYFPLLLETFPYEEWNDHSLLSPMISSLLMSPSIPPPFLVWLGEMLKDGINDGGCTVLVDVEEESFLQDRFTTNLKHFVSKMEQDCDFLELEILYRNEVFFRKGLSFLHFFLAAGVDCPGLLIEFSFRALDSSSEDDDYDARDDSGSHNGEGEGGREDRDGNHNDNGDGEITRSNAYSAACAEGAGFGKKHQSYDTTKWSSCPIPQLSLSFDEIDTTYLTSVIEGLKSMPKLQTFELIVEESDNKPCTDAIIELLEVGLMNDLTLKGAGLTIEFEKLAIALENSTQSTSTVEYFEHPPEETSNPTIYYLAALNRHNRAKLGACNASRDVLVDCLAPVKDFYRSEDYVHAGLGDWPPLELSLLYGLLREAPALWAGKPTAGGF